MIHIKIFFSKLRSVMTKCINEIGATNLFLLFLLAIILIYPLLSVGFTTHDDVFMALNKWSGHTWEITRNMSMEQGRIGFFWGIPLSAVPFIFDNQVWYLIVKYGSLLLVLFSLYYAVLKVFKSSWIAIASVSFFLAIVQNGWEHNALTSYPMVFNLYAVLFLVSIGLFATAIDRKKIILAIFSGVLYFFTFGIELFVLFFPFYIAVLLSRMEPRESVMKKIKLNKEYILAVLMPVVVFLLIYLIWRHFFPSGYEGNSLNGFDLSLAFNAIATYSLSAFPLASLHFYTTVGDPSSFSSSIGLREFLSELTVVSFIKSIVVGFLFARLMMSAHSILPRAKVILFGAVTALIGIFLPNLLLGFTLRHQSWVAGGTHSFVYTFYSFIFSVVFLALLLAYANVKSLPWHPKLRLLFISVIVIIVMMVSFFVEIRNQHLALDQKLAQRKWDLMDVVIKSSAFNKIPNDSSVIASTLLSYTHGIAVVNLDDWSDYVKYKTGKRIQFINAKCENVALCYDLVFRQETNSDSQFIVLKKIENLNSPDPVKLTIYSMPAHTDAMIIGSYISNNSIAQKIEVDGKSVVNVGAGLFSSVFSDNFKTKDGLVQIATISGNVDFDLERFTISRYNIEPRLRSLSAELVDGINFGARDYPDFIAEVSGMSGSETWGRWTDANINPTTKFILKKALPKKFTLEINAKALESNMGKQVKVRVGNLEKTFVIDKTSTYSAMVFETDGEADTIEIISPNPTSPNEIDSKNPDTRKLGIGLISLKIIE